MKGKKPVGVVVVVVVAAAAAVREGKRWMRRRGILSWGTMYNVVHQYLQSFIYIRHKYVAPQTERYFHNHTKSHTCVTNERNCTKTEKYQTT